MKPSLKVKHINFYDAPSNIEGAPYWVDLWASINGYRIGLQIKPRSYKSASVAIYSGKTISSQKKGNKLFESAFGGKVFIATPTMGALDKLIEDTILEEANRLSALPEGKHPELP